MKEEKERKRILWNCNNETGIISATLPSSKKEINFDLNLLDSSEGEKQIKFLDFSPIQKELFYYGVKQLLSDSTARNKEEKLDDEGKVFVMKKTFDEFISGEFLKASSKEKKERKKKDKVRTVYTLEELELKAGIMGIEVEVLIETMQEYIPGLKIEKKKEKEEKEEKEEENV